MSAPYLTIYRKSWPHLSWCYFLQTPTSNFGLWLPLPRLHGTSRLFYPVCACCVLTNMSRPCCRFGKTGRTATEHRSLTFQKRQLLAVFQRLRLGVTSVLGAT